MKKLSQVVSFLLSAFCAMPMVACFGGEGDEIDETKTQLQVAFVDSGTGSAAIIEKARRFEEAYKVMIDSMGTHFDPNLLPAFEHARPKLEAYYTESKTE